MTFQISQQLKIKIILIYHSLKMIKIEEISLNLTYLQKFRIFSNFSSAIPYFYIQYLTEFRKRSLTNIHLPQMSLQQQLLFIESGQFKSKLCSILVSLEQQNQDQRRSYNNKISHLEAQITYKDKQIAQLSNKVDEMEKKCQTQQWKILEKDNIIEDLTNKLKNVQSKFKQKLHCLIDRVDLTSNDQDSTGMMHRKNTEQTNKRINISEYFIKAIQNSKISTKADGDAPSQVSSSLQSYNYPSKLCQTESEDMKNLKGRLNSKNSPPKLEKVRSMQKETFMRESDWKFQENNNCSNAIQNVRQGKEIDKKRIIIQDNLLIRKKIDNPQIIKQYGYLKERQKERDRQIENMTENKKIQPKRAVLEQKWKKLSAFQQNSQNPNILFYK